MLDTENVKKANLKVKLYETLFGTADLSKNAAFFESTAGTINACVTLTINYHTPL